MAVTFSDSEMSFDASTSTYKNTRIIYNIVNIESNQKFLEPWER